MRSSPDGGRAWCALAAALASGAALGYGRDPVGLDWQPTLAFVEPARLFSAAFVHYSGLHLLANVAGAALVGALGFVARVPVGVFEGEQGHAAGAGVAMPVVGQVQAATAGVIEGVHVLPGRLGRSQVQQMVAGDGEPGAVGRVGEGG